MSDTKVDPWALLREAQKTLDEFIKEGSDERDGPWFRLSIMSFCDHIDQVFEDREHNAHITDHAAQPVKRLSDEDRVKLLQHK